MSIAPSAPLSHDLFSFPLSSSTHDPSFRTGTTTCSPSRQTKERLSRKSLAQSSKNALPTANPCAPNSSRTGEERWWRMLKLFANTWRASWRSRICCVNTAFYPGWTAEVFWVGIVSVLSFPKIRISISCTTARRNSILGFTPKFSGEKTSLK